MFDKNYAYAGFASIVVLVLQSVPAATTLVFGIGVVVALFNVLVSYQ